MALVDADQTHREHAIVEPAIAELKDGPLAHLPSGSYAANAAWLAHAVIAFNIARRGRRRTGQCPLRTRIINVPARIHWRATGAAPTSELAMGVSLKFVVDHRDTAASPDRPHNTAQ